jgi:hypothetical protein
LQSVEIRRETSRVSFLMCPFCVRALFTVSTTSRARCAIDEFVCKNSDYLDWDACGVKKLGSCPRGLCR